MQYHSNKSSHLAEILGHDDNFLIIWSLSPEFEELML